MGRDISQCVFHFTLRPGWALLALARDKKVLLKGARAAHANADPAGIANRYNRKKGLRAFRKLYDV
jgi:hypothetical protein